MPAFFTGAHLKLSLLLSILGAVVALVFTLFSESGAVALIFRPLVSGLLMFILGTILYALLAKKVPEAIEAMEQDPNGEGELPDLDISDSAMDGDAAAEGEDAIDNAGVSNMSDYSSHGDPGGAASNIPRKKGVQIGKDEIVVDGVKFKNEPEVMAQTIKELMDQDKD
jgi:predicted membrane channel-forming protein YqfA (hemolysin III family)